jgi:hypothetical protein
MDENAIADAVAKALKAERQRIATEEKAERQRLAVAAEEEALKTLKAERKRIAEEGEEEDAWKAKRKRIEKRRAEEEEEEVPHIRSKTLRSLIREQDGDTYDATCLCCRSLCNWGCEAIYVSIWIFLIYILTVAWSKS